MKIIGTNKINKIKGTQYLIHRIKYCVPLILPLIFLFACIFVTLLHAAPVKQAHTEVELISEDKWIQPGRPFWLAVRMHMDESWHTYWKNPGDAGLATSITWDLPEGFHADPIQWPYPQQLKIATLVTYGYEGEIFLLSRIHPPKSLAAPSDIPIKARVNWLACKLGCIAGEGELGLTLPVKDSLPEKDESSRSSFALTRARLPQAMTHERPAVREREEDFVVLWPSSSAEQEDLSAVQFFPDRNDIIDHAAPQEWSKTHKGNDLVLTKSSLILESIERMQGVLVLSSGKKGAKEKTTAYAVDVPVSAAQPPSGQEAPVEFNKENPHFLLSVFFAFLGGLILNLMPCVLPVLSLKILNLINHAGEDQSKTWQQGVLFSLGILSAFWMLAGIMLILRSWGEHVGWGFQFQSPRFILFLSVLFFVFGLNLLGVFEIGTSFARLGGRERHLSNKWNAFLSGILATIVATPCTAPFMGTAIGMALTQPYYVVIAIFSSLGLGMSVPFLILARFPQFLNFLPKPGPWMIKLRRLLGFFLMATVAWLAWILGLQLGANALFGLLWGLLLIGVGLWVFGTWVQNTTHHAGRRISALITGILIVIGLMIMLKGFQGDLPLFKDQPLPFIKSTESDLPHLEWQDYSPELIASLRAERKPVFIDFTAAWCLSCQVNERMVFRSKQVLDKFREMGIVAVKADWTTRDEKITRALRGYGKNSIPLYVIYGRDPTKAPLILPEIITPGIVIEALEKIDGQKG